MPPKRKPAKRKTPTATTYKNKADRLFSRVVRSEGVCAECNTTKNLQCAHIESRTYRSTRWDERNAVCLCASCHLKFTWNPAAWSIWVKGRFGTRFYWANKHRALAVAPKPDWVELIHRLEARLEEVSA